MELGRIKKQGDGSKKKKSNISKARNSEENETLRLVSQQHDVILIKPQNAHLIGEV